MPSKGKLGVRVIVKKNCNFFKKCYSEKNTVRVNLKSKRVYIYHYTLLNIFKDMAFALQHEIVF